MYAFGLIGVFTFPYFDHDAFTNQALQALDASERNLVLCLSSPI